MCTELLEVCIDLRYKQWYAAVQVCFGVNSLAKFTQLISDIIINVFLSILRFINNRNNILKVLEGHSLPIEVLNNIYIP